MDEQMDPTRKDLRRVREDADDAEGHAKRGLREDEARDDTEGHRSNARRSLSNEGEDDAEGHKYGSKRTISNEGDEDDAEGHSAQNRRH
jgi:hypothetical protein